MPVPNSSYSRNQFCFPVLESTWGTAVTPTGSNGCLITSLTTDAVQGEIPRPDKTGSLGEIIGIPDRRTSTWAAGMSMAGNGAPGVKPDCDVLLQLVFGKAVSISAGVSSTYALDDNGYSASIWHYNDPSTVAQYLAFGAVCNQLKISFGGAVPTLEFSGPALWTLDTDQLADGTTDSIAKAGIVTWTARPTPTVNGKPPQGFVGQITLDGNTHTTLRTGSITLAVARELPGDVFNNMYSAAPAPGLRAISTDFNLYDDDSPNLVTLKQKAAKKTPMNFGFQIGTTAGNIWTFNLKNVTLPMPKVDTSVTRRAIAFSNARAHDTTIGAKDALNLVIT